jgi:hypothetical protein
LLLYQHKTKKSRLFRQFQYLRHLFLDGFEIISFMRPQAIAAILDAIFRIDEVSAAFIPQGVQWAIAEQAAEGFRIRALMAGEVFALLMLEKIIMRH